MNASGETLLPADLLTPTGQRLTPTGKISHAKTRVYTQRYRKEWEQMPDFKGTTRLPFVDASKIARRSKPERSTPRDIAMRRSCPCRATLDAAATLTVWLPTSSGHDLEQSRFRFLQPVNYF